MMDRLLFKRWNDLGGWLAFIIAAFVYGTTIEPTASFWDCPEFISCAEKLQIGHPPGAPFYMLAGNLFTQFASDASQVSRMVNLLNALLSAGCILFLYWSITRLAKPLIAEGDQELSVKGAIIVLGSGLVGALAYTFSDTFWFSAVEGEVYAFSSFLTALVFWMMLRWQDESALIRGDRWIILIAYIIGLSIGVHLLNLLCIPAIVLVFYYRKYQVTSVWGVICALLVSALLIVFILFVYIPGIADLGGYFELLFVNVMGCPVQSGLIVFVLLMLLLLIAAICRFRKKRLLHTSLWCLLMLSVGYTSYAVILIRANANTPLNENAPDNIFTLKSYLNREQYESVPLIYGKSYASEPEYIPDGDHYRLKMKEGNAVYRFDKEQGKYVIINHKQSVSYTSNMLFPRMWNDHMASVYKNWSEGGDTPTQKENLVYFIHYQLNHMYWRYFLWNFVGRQNDIQGSGEPEHGNWLTGISLLDNLRLGNQELLPESLKENKGYNVFYGLPLLLGFIGIYWQLTRGRKGKQQFNVLFFLFFMTGIAIVLYLNQAPNQPRERDYAYAGSFYAFAIWIGLGVAGICDKFRKKNVSIIFISLVLLVCLLVPIQMASQTWDDHDRSNRFTCRDFGSNYLLTLPEKGNPIIFCNGDNDTFPLWYNQDTEGIRRDARICNLSYAQTDWYIYQQQCPLYDAPGLPISWKRSQYQEGTNEYVVVRPELKKQVEEFYQKHPEEARKTLGDDPFEIKNLLKYWVFSENEDFHVIPTDSISLRIDKEAVIRSGILLPDTIRHLKGEELRNAIPDKIYISMKNKNMLTKTDLLVLEILANCNWERPLYMAISVGDVTNLQLDKYFIQEGLAYRFTPFESKKGDDAEKKSEYAVDVERLYQNMMVKYKYGGLDKPGLYLDETTMRICYSHRRLFALLAVQLIKQGDDSRARKVLAYSEQMIPAYNVPEVYESGSFDIAMAYSAVGETAKAVTLLKRLTGEAEDYINWALTLGNESVKYVHSTCLSRFGQWNLYNELMKTLDEGLYKQSRHRFEEQNVQFLNLLNGRN